ncbi:hypothetical protein ACWT_5325 [Actinoplanes sp. SE50]|uniref:hypothetical protein n=1 Tax=unclassified Actinoplanes TaxID=2626549 RepID=UPI00023EC14C|nr:MULTISPECIES: hypothetical protein [unclassified Actinoplanes]AEV86343.1 hypothetical protein ACPL_5456 [Actinoplanes sp. SE50/110]ATO84740.1 hypothetical protein ACWT_5325 [Actinoplanes sp. SE50]SLM02150.1 hypothetical protein ACSP50_5388 [Actinoplanes sp. SE50/110]
MTTGYRLSLARTALFALVYAAAVYAGRRTAMVADGVSLVWPAAGWRWSGSAPTAPRRPGDSTPCSWP